MTKERNEGEKPTYWSFRAGEPGLRPLISRAASRRGTSRARPSYAKATEGKARSPMLMASGPYATQKAFEKVTVSSSAVANRCKIVFRPERTEKNGLRHAREGAVAPPNAQQRLGGLIAARKAKMDRESEPNVEQVLEEIRARLQRQIAGALERGDLSSPAAAGDSQGSLGLNDLLTALETAQRQLGSINPRPAGFANDLLQSLKKGIRKLIGWYFRPVAHYQSVASQFLAEAARILERQQVQLRSMEEKIEALRVELDQLRLQMQSKRGLAASKLEQRDRNQL